MKKIHVLFITFLFLISCAGFEEAGKVLRNEKIKTTDEFLVEKKSPLVMPPEYNELPIPKIGEDEDEIKSKEGSNNIEKLITNNDKKPDDSLEKNENFENSIINQIKKN